MRMVCAGEAGRDGGGAVFKVDGEVLLRAEAA